MAQGGKKTQLRIVDCKPVYHGRNDKGDEYTIHEIRAAKVTGELITETLRSFTALPVGQTVEVSVVSYVSQKYGKSFTLYPTDQKSAGTTGQVNDLTETVEQLGEMIARLTQRVSALEKGANGFADATVSHATHGALDSAELDAKFGADPPFD